MRGLTRGDVKRELPGVGAAVTGQADAALRLCG